MEHCFLVESTKIKNASFLYKSAISDANVKTDRKVSTKWTYHKERSFSRNCFIFLKGLLTLSWRRPLSYRNQSKYHNGGRYHIRNQSWFLYDNGLPHERGKNLFKRIDLMYQLPKYSYSYFLVRIWIFR